MKKLILVILLLIPILVLAQYPIVEEFDSVTTWTYNNGAGMQNYGGTENYATFNVGTTPYPNSSTIRILSPLYDLSDCSTNLNVTFILNGRIENTYDYMYFQYFDGVWNTLGTFTGIQSGTFTYSIPNTTTRLRFRLITDASFIVWYRPTLTGSPSLFPTAIKNTPVDISNHYVTVGGILNIYYYDITNVIIDCPSTLPIELLSFTGKQEGDYNLLKWITVSEINNDFFTLEKSLDANNFVIVAQVSGAGNSTSMLSYSLEDTKPYVGITYYRLSQTDYNGNSKLFNIISVSRMSTGKDLKVIRITNLLGQEITDEEEGVKIYYFSDGSVIKKCKLK